MNNTARARRLLRILGVAVVVVYCGRDSATGPGRNATLERVGAAERNGTGLSRLASALAVRAMNGSVPEAGVPVRFAVVHGAASGAALSDTLTTTDDDGVARTALMLGDGADSLVVVARAPSGASATFIVHVAPPADVRSVSPPAFSGGDTLTLRGSGLLLAAAPGIVRFGDASAAAHVVTDSLVRVVAPPCLPQGMVDVFVHNVTARSRSTRALYRGGGTAVTLGPLDGITVPAAELDDCIVLEGAEARYLVVPHFGLGIRTPEALDIEFGAAIPPVTAFASSARPAAPARQLPAFEAVLRRRESALAAAAPRAAARASAAAAVPRVGDLRAFRVISALDATAFATVRARLAYAGANVIVWVDTLAPSEFPANSIGSLARLIDEDLYGVPVTAFGAPSDVDGDGRVHIVLTPVVNALTPAGFCSLSGFVGAFFSAHDLYPGSANSNGAEVLYGFVPDTSGVYGCPHSTEEFARVLPVVFVHELQHAISYHQHVLRRGGTEEEVWLNEGLSHMAEELGSKYYESRYPWPSGRESPAQLFPDSSSAFILFNLVNAYLFLRQPFASSLTGFQDGGTIEERGAAWMFLRWLADLYGEGILRELVQSPLSGAANIESRTQVPFARTIGDFAIALYADSLPGVPRASVAPQWRFQSRNWRLLFQRLNEIANFPPFPVDLLPVPLGGAVTGSLRAGGFVYLAVDVPADTPALTLQFRRLGGAPWATGYVPRVSIFRLQ